MTNGIESMNISLCKTPKNRGSFPSDGVLTKLLYLTVKNISENWNMSRRAWKAELNRFTTDFEDRIPQQ